MDRTNLSTAPLKTEAKALRRYLAKQDINLGHSKCLEAVAQMHGFKNWDEASACYEAPSEAPELPPHWEIWKTAEGQYEANWGAEHGDTFDTREEAVEYARTVWYDASGIEWKTWVAMAMSMPSSREEPCPYCNEGRRFWVNYLPEHHGHISMYLWQVLDNGIDRSRLSPVPVQRALDEARRTVSRWQVTTDRGLEWCPQAKVDVHGKAVDEQTADHLENRERFEYIPVRFNYRTQKHEAYRPGHRELIEKSHSVEWPDPPRDADPATPYFASVFKEGGPGGARWRVHVLVEHRPTGAKSADYFDGNYTEAQIEKKAADMAHEMQSQLAGLRGLPYPAAMEILHSRNPPPHVVVVNGKEVFFPQHAISYEHLVKHVFGGLPEGTVMTVTYKGVDNFGTLTPGKQVWVEPGMVFNVMDTSMA